MILFKFIIICLLIIENDALFGNSLKQLREKVSKIYKTHKKGVNLNYMGLIASDYPGTNEKYIKMNEEYWEEYYTCLKQQQDNLGKYQSMIPQAILGFEGTNVKLECKICISPLERHIKDSIKWEWAPIGGKYLEPVDYNENIVISPEDKTLQLYNLETTHSGQYMCVLGETSTIPYFLTIVKLKDEEIIEVHSADAALGPYPRNPDIIQNYGLVLDTEWSEWSTCSTCGRIGRRHKLGYCSIFSKANKNLTIASNPIDEYLQLSENEENSTDSKIIIDVSSTTNIKDSTDNYVKTKLEINADDLELFSVFQFGIPCESHILPENIRNLPQVKARKNEIMMGYCKVKCPKNVIFMVKDTHGNIIEKVNNSEGIYSLLQPLPPMEPAVERQLMYAVKGKPLVLTCPGSMNTDVPIHWQIADKNLIPEVIAAESNKRIFISITDRIHIKVAKISDSNIYSCWQREELAGTIRLVVEKKIELDFNHSIMLFGIVVILSMLLHIFVKAYAGRKYAKIY